MKDAEEREPNEERVDEREHDDAEERGHDDAEEPSEAERDDAVEDAHKADPGEAVRRARAGQHRAPSFLRKHGLALGLSSVLLVGGGYVLFVDSGSISTSESEARKNLLLPAWRLDDIRRVEVALGEARYVLDRAAKSESDDRWTLRQDGTDFPAEEQVVDRFLSVLQHTRVVRRVAKGSVDRAELGLDQPRFTLKISMGELAFEVRVGKPTSTGDGVYAELVGREIVVIPAPDASQLEVRPEDLRSKAFVPYLSTQLARLELDGEGGKRVFERAPWGGGRGSGFRFGAGGGGPTGQRVDGTRLDQVLVSFGRMQADSFLDEATANAKSEPRVTITMTPKEGPVGTLVVGGECPERPGFVIVVRRAPTFIAACVPEVVVPALLRPVEDFVDDGVVGASVDEITELRVARGEKVLELARFGGGFKVRHPEEKDLDADTGNELLKDIVGARGEPAPADAVMPAEPTHVKITSQGGIADGGGTVTRVEELEVGALGNGKLLVLRKEDGARILLDEAVGAAFAPSDLLLRDLAVLDASPLAIKELSVEHEGSTQTVVRDGGELSLSAPKGKGLVPDEPFATAAFNVFGKLKATRWVADEAQPSFGLDKPRYRIRATVEDGGKDTVVTVLLGQKTDDGVYATLQGEKAVFFVDGFTEAAFDRNFISREAFTIDAGELDAVKLKTSGKELELKRKGRQLLLTSGSEAKSAEIVKALGELIPLSAVSTGPAKREQGLDTASMTVELASRKGSDGDRGAIVKIAFGAADSALGASVRYARRDDVDATYALPQLAVERLEELLRR